ncbi:hypothetical protein C343_04763 [Cryptococcus neoformans C23]|uniref:Uncharacterized protein n=1 Tax=Cryptococcus neoformans (strain H99 / ATCC 208821 / CBS 10515 / FGSC 9487) TaxID=235443 RepID=J9VY47_CRYN9|nr:hypothetical protein CNAG_03411 [Cryptococcus neoformans var. grubii H99]AUB26576.1 hypothetical protein CKF44_03411 [Cryptococcus neoformans var. grubii]OWZ29729.1 hypothetical protein C347_04811 [Cryptococcus neoformans var. grubii AD2-60a]OWZ41601.1 hypothetical protein C343_04763 [Cryptococcus neoformans var. grubii C23]OXC83343.1 hypothetical protein C344_04489 [Cryptococcus neoformans var. grubii AD1-7a]AFR96635.2 hypothetical protein CNAG_03411 [Cryptococcus neoformans var. grubii H9|eukprot:XP_012050944.1 hypothetical protein CNAG_03411 [Cryptococcus neoformans var. grubii H99]
MTHFQVFLPPSSLPSLPSFKDAAVISTEQLLTFHRLNPPPREGSHLLPPPNNPSNNPPASSYVHRMDQPEATGHGQKMSVLGKRTVSSRAVGSHSEQNEDILTPEECSRSRMPPPPSPPITNRPSVRTSPRRASKKLVTRPSYILPSSMKGSTPLPDQGQEQSLGLDSTLNTTASWPSQIPPSAGAETSIFNFPSWSVPTSRLTSLQDVLKKGSAPQRGGLVFDNGYGGKERYNIIACIVSVDTPLERQRKTQLGMRGKGRGRQDANDTLWIGKWMITAPPDGNEGQVSCVVRLWDECAKDWGDEKVRKGDVVLLENVELKSTSAKELAHLVLTPSSRPKIIILYRILPRYVTTMASDYIYRAPGAVPHHLDGERKRDIIKEDRYMRPDLRLGSSDVGVRKVAAVVEWFADWIGGEGHSA